MPFRPTDHARARLQQRGIPESVLECLLTNGLKVNDHRGGEFVFFVLTIRNALPTFANAARI
jgi:hypothetical protein